MCHVTSKKYNIGSSIDKFCHVFYFSYHEQGSPKCRTTFWSLNISLIENKLHQTNKVNICVLVFLIFAANQQRMEIRWFFNLMCLLIQNLIWNCRVILIVIFIQVLRRIQFLLQRLVQTYDVTWERWISKSDFVFEILWTALSDKLHNREALI